MKATIKNLYSQLLSSRYLLKEWEGTSDSSEKKAFRLVFFSHYDQNGIVHNYVLDYLKQLAQNNCCIIFVSTSPTLEKSSIELIQPYCHRIILRENIGLDFGSWRMAYDRYKKLLSKASALLLLNDSCFGPFFELKPILDSFDQPNTISGITLNKEVTPHLQSYFLYIPKDVFSSSFFKRFISGVQYYSDKNRIIYEYEIGFSTMALNAGYTLNPWVKNEQLTQKYSDVNGDKNLTIWYCDLLLKEKLSPFIKKAVFTDTQALIPVQYNEIIKVLQKEYPEQNQKIESYLRISQA
jgi:lipopolysaccharide biosynthesis protein